MSCFSVATLFFRILSLFLICPIGQSGIAEAYPPAGAVTHRSFVLQSSPDEVMTDGSLAGMIAPAVVHWIAGSLSSRSLFHPLLRIAGASATDHATEPQPTSIPPVVTFGIGGRFF
jgi:hypothetical protein